jgi:Xaa-Pro dipeptidase
MVITVEPGCYFIEFLLSDKSPVYIDTSFVKIEKYKEYLSVGGVRLEDNVVITETGTDNLTVVPRTVAQIEAAMRGEDWKSA